MPRRHTFASTPRITFVETLERRLFLSGSAATEAPVANILVKFSPSAGDVERRQIIAAHGLSKRGEIGAIGLDLLTVAPGESPQAVVNRLNGLYPDSIEYVEVDQVLAPTFTPDDPLYPDQWSHTNIGSEAAWDVTTGSPGVVVSVLDTGINETHEDFGTGRFLTGWNTYENSSNTSDEHGHGTRVTGALAAVGNNGVGVAGVNWGASLRPVRVSHASGGADFYSIAAGIIYA